MSARRIESGAPWEATGGYSHAVVHRDMVWVSGTTALVDGRVAHPGDAAGQTRQALTRVRDVLESAGFTLDHVVRTRLFVTDISRWQEISQVHGEVFAAIRPATTMVQVSALFDPAMLIEIEADAIR